MTGLRTNDAREIALEILLRVEREKAYSNLLLGSVLENSCLSRNDRALVTELVYGAIAHKTRLDYAVSRYLKGEPERLEDWVRILLRLSFYQLLFLDRVPAYAAVSEAVRIAKKRGHEGIARLVNGLLRSFLREPGKAEIPPGLDPASRLSLQYSHPEWLVRRWLAQFGEWTTERILKANNEPPPVSIRANILKISRDELLQRLNRRGEEAQASRLSPQGIRLGRGGNPARHPEYREGLFTIQDESSMLVGHLLGAKPGMRLLDACAAPGGKATHAAELMGNQGEILANDLHPHKERLIRQQAGRLGITIIATAVGDAATLPERVTGHFERILLDAPCTGFGVIRRKPDLKWNRREEDIAAIAELQFRLLSCLAPLLQPGGKLIYSTCTIEPEENRLLIERFLAQNPLFQLDPDLEGDLPCEHLRAALLKPGMVQILPHCWDTDGFFIARLVRREGVQNDG